MCIFYSYLNLHHDLCYYSSTVPETLNAFTVKITDKSVPKYVPARVLLIPHAYPRFPCNSSDITVERCRYEYNGFIAMQICLRYVRYILTMLARVRSRKIALARD